MKQLLAVARGDESADFVIRGARVANVFTLEYEEVDVAVFGDKIAGVGKNYEGKNVIDATGQVLIPGMIDGHIHIESTMLAPAVFADNVVTRGTTAVMADPHEIANVRGMKGVEYLYLASRGLPIDVFLGAPSCVAASHLETPFEELEMDRVGEMFRQGWCQHLGEVMNYPGVIAGDDAVWGKMQAAGNVPLTGHCPGVRGKQLCAYMAGGISSDHECSEPDDALEKLRRGMWLMLREGASAPDMRKLLPLLRENKALFARCMAVTDDTTAKYLVRTGHMDAMVRIMVEEGIDPLVALRMVTLSPASYFGLNNRGAIAPGLIADMVLVGDLENCRADKVWKNGRLVVDGGKLCRRNVSVAEAVLARPPILEESAFRIHPLTTKQLEVPAPKYAEMRVIGVQSDSLVTKTLLITPPVDSGLAVADAKRDIAKIVAQERHRDTGRFSVGFVSGLGMKTGALASSVAHDAHNFVAVGMDDLSIATALAHLGSNAGGLVVTSGKEILGYFALPVAGLMTTLDADSTLNALDELEDKARGLGIAISHPFMVLSFLCLSVIPELKITDQGYVDITHGGIQPLFSFTEFR